MATCKDCVHSPVCRLPFNTSETQVNFAEECHHFKNKADFVEVKHGEWLVDDFKRQNKKFLICSECRAVIDCNVNYIDENEYDFCPYCGADMRKDDSNG